MPRDKYPLVLQVYKKYRSSIRLKRAHKNISLRMLCTLARVSESGYYKWLQSTDIREVKYGQEISDYYLIKKIFDEENETAGFRTIVMQLFEQHSLIMNHKKVIRIMRKYGLECKIRRKKSYGNTFSKQRIENTYENLLDTTFNCTEPTTIFHTDITYIKYAHGRKTAYLSAVKDEATREITAHATSESLQMPFVINTLERLKMLNISSNAVIHSDQGVHYTSNSYKDKIQELGLKGSMSRRGKCVDNAPIESFFGHMKDEVNFNKLETYEEVVEVINSYIYKYNYLRPQWTLKKMTPVKYRNHLLNIA